jgi:hypothetical protein
MTDVDGLLDGARRPVVSKETLGKLAELLERSGVDLTTVARVKTIKAWQGFQKGEDGEPQVVDLYGMEFVPTFADGPQWPVIQPGPAVKLPLNPVKPVKVAKKAKSANGWKTAVIYPDMQMGYYRGADGLKPTHDEWALDIAHRVTADLRPDVVVFNGDNADFPELSRYRHSPAWQQTTQPTIDRCTRLNAEVRDAAGDAEVFWLEGNHELRLSNFIIDNAGAAFGLRKGEAPESWPVLSLPHLTHMDKYGVTYLPGYPANVHWLNDRLRVIHGNRVKSNGSTAHLYLNDSKVSTIYGHVHRREWAEKTRQDRDGAKTILAASGGCLALRDGAVPSTNGGMDLDGRPIESAENWQAGFIVVTYQEGDAPFSIEMVAIHDNRALFRGNEYAA